MKNDFKKMEEEMDNLSVKMSAITAFNDKISNTLQDKRLQITKLSGVHALLRKVCEFFLYTNSPCCAVFYRVSQKTGHCLISCNVKTIN
jgi:hypothetical protein